MTKGFTRGISILLVGSLLSTGCAKTQVTTVARLDGQRTQALQRVPATGTYKAMWTDIDRHHLQTIAGSERFAHKGEHLGFAKVDGQLLATHNDVRLQLSRLPSRAKYVVWRNQQTVKTQFGREMDKLGENSLVVLQKTAIVVIAAGLIAWVGYEAYKHPESFFSSDDCEQH